ncbi:UDP-N-acetylmuramoyl-L-alanine ligase [Micromonospora sp. ATCC 39149]|uniref:UDP-N-acetylmuramoyl-L-alanine--D-glutamate ligase n=1 Tax=Micromonospora carbonacea TaxID=47853 RepID=A0A7D5YEK1_9ACTN|nr:Mur ligase domain-containing protein [Micromonospora sp. ATCC 39149]EEP71319.1 UDP-N-acetylmuramoyl-L-alanine ligase [Micromonospora sp. ATCC 39149]QLJ97596.1 UDP-N-acetylmuramoyl-L-alanine--D-glutamate ligase [Micromonospora carbonacea]
MTDTIDSHSGPIDLSRPYLVGVGGPAMSGLARLLAELGHQVSGSDIHDSDILAALRTAGVRVRVGHDAAYVEGASCVVHTTGARHAPEVRAARAAGIPVVRRAQVLDKLADGRRLVAVSGSHGKSTTAGMLVHILRTLGQDPTYLIGADLTGPGSGAHLGRSRLLVAEADESYRSFHLLSPSLAVVTNVTDDHPSFVSRADVLRAYVEFGCRVAPDGFLIVNADCVGATVAAQVIADERPDLMVLRCGRDRAADVRLLDVHAEGWSVSATVRMPNGTETRLTLPTPATHHLHDAAAAVACAVALGLDPADVTAAVGTFAGVRRRFEHIDTRAGVTVIDSYASHPNEIAADLQAARTLARGRVFVVFQPSGHARVLALGERIGRVLALDERIGRVLADNADYVLLLDVPDNLSDGRPLADTDAIAARLRDGAYCLPLGPDHAARVIARMAGRGDVVLTMGTGDVTGYGAAILDGLGRRAEVALSA